MSRKRNTMESSRKVYTRAAHQYDYIMGIDEVGLGAIAGPIYYAGVVFAKDQEISPLVRDSKSVTGKNAPLLREGAYWFVRASSLGYVHTRFDWDHDPDLYSHLDSCVAQVIENTFAQCQTHVTPLNTLVVVDGNRVPDVGTVPYKIVAIPKADAVVPSVSAASCLAKHLRDEEMIRYDVPGFSFDKHKGYPTAQHFSELAEHGVTEFHRPNVISLLEDRKIDVRQYQAQSAG